MDLREHYKSYKVIVTKLIENKQADEITLSITKFTAINMVTKDKYDAHVIVVINEKNKYGFILYRLSSEEAYIYMVIPGTIPIAHAFVVKASNNNMLDYFKELSKGLETISYLTNESKWSVMSIELERVSNTLTHQDISDELLQFNGRLIALAVDGGWNCFLDCATICGVADLTLGAICSIACGLCTLENISCTICGYCLIVLGATTVGCLMGCGIYCLLTGG
uniref:Uncharacterized protein n=1 Tax=Ignisphaera aggregans TaxID=334771 RepID=A0A7J3Z964_9CREN